ncbi:hypothetical protein PPERSA_08611 [Pseudocohnilembus persalinus]|uniref:Uncharacterized protein n=1 Tax=Pseudocohnilembus persalinus TaxID=266149 RepID=A0A0V0R522_PSEPJ|nr:hypothetical protein PPERSA_08611 [Pseudocohnilembus persalinus]|eukprot:KRX09579.1 hypothetical protein PPERSA_08611 [Pseudocohnilembus persalinus]
MFVGLMERIKSIQITIERGSMIAAMYIKGEIQLPDKNQMLKSWDEDIKHLQQDDPTMTRLFQIRPTFSELDYNKELAELAKKELDYDFEQQTIAIKKIQNAEWSPFDQKLQRQTNFNSLCPKEPSENLF